MQLIIRVVEGRNLPAMDLNGFSDPYVKLQLGKQRYKTRVVNKNLNPTWGDEFSFRVDDLSEELVVSVLDEDKYFNDDFVGQFKMPVSFVFDAEYKSLGTAWYSLQPKNKKSKNNDCGEILLTIYFSHNNSLSDLQLAEEQSSQLKRHSDIINESPMTGPAFSSASVSPLRPDETEYCKDDKYVQKRLAGRIAQIFNKNEIKGNDFSEQPEVPKLEANDNNMEDRSSSGTFEELMAALESRDDGFATPSDLSGGVLVDQLYVMAPKELNAFLFGNDSDFLKSVADFQGTTEMQVGPWKFENGGESLKRNLTYVKAATKLIKAVKGYEEQTYLKADGNVFAVLASVSTPDVIYGSTFKVELLFCITHGPELPSGEKSSRLLLSWRMNFLQSTMMKGMIENGARQGLKDSFEQFAHLLSQRVKPVDSKDIGSSKEQLLASLQGEPQSDWKLAAQYFANFTVVSTIIVGLYVLFHISMAIPDTIKGLEFTGLDLPDSIGEFIVSGILVLQGQRVLELMARFMQARAQKGSDHGIKAQGDGWLLTVALIEGTNMEAVDTSGFSDPYVVFTCNGRTRTSSIKFQKSDPLWNEIFEFDAMDEPPSVLDVDVYDFDGPFDEATSLGHAEVNFVKTNISDLADVWVPLRGKLAQACQSKLHLRIFLNNTKGSHEVVKEYLTKMEKEVGKKLNLRSPQTNSAFQKLFGLPPEEFLINDFTCHLRRKMPIQGRLFLSARTIGFHANLFGHKTKFFFLWGDIEEIQVLPPTLASMGSPIVVITLRLGRGLDARHCARTQDEDGRLKFYFQSFVSFNVAQRTIMALWKARSLSLEQKVQIVAEDSEAKSLQSEESGTFLDLGEDVSLSEVFSSALPVSTSYIMELFAGGELERRIMEKAGCIEYSHSPWELEKEDTYQRQIYFKFDKRVSRYRGEVTSTQQKSPLSDKAGWIVEEVMTLHAIPLGDYFNLHVRYQIEDASCRSQGCNVQVFFGMAWLKSTKYKKRITKNILSNLQDRLKVMFGVSEKEHCMVAQVNSVP